MRPLIALLALLFFWPTTARAQLLAEIFVHECKTLPMAYGFTCHVEPAGDTRKLVLTISDKFAEDPDRADEARHRRRLLIFRFFQAGQRSVKFVDATAVPRRYQSCSKYRARMDMRCDPWQSE